MKIVQSSVIILVEYLCTRVCMWVPVLRMYVVERACVTLAFYLSYVRTHSFMAFIPDIHHRCAYTLYNNVPH